MTIRVQRPDGMQQGGDVPAVEDAPFFYGGISRETAEWILWERGCQDGLFLLRQRGPDYVLSLCCQKSVLHYRIRRCSGNGGGFGLCGLPAGGRQFRDPLELLASGVEGLACRPCVPCNRALDAMLPPTHWGLPDDAVRAFMLLKARHWGVDESRLDVAPSPTGSGPTPDLRALLAKTLHEVQPWFHGPLSRAEAERRLQDAGHLDGKFLVRERDDASYALCLSHGGSVKHYKIDVAPSGDFAIQDGQQFPSLMSLISHYTLFSDGLWCPLTEACPRPGFVGSAGSRTTSGGLGTRAATSRGGTLPHQHSGAHHHQSGTGSRILSNVRTGILQRLVATISPQTMERSRTMPRLRSGGGGGSAGGGGTGVVGSSERPPSRSEARLQKASSFDHLLPGFLSLLFASPDAGDAKSSSKSPREDPPPPPRWRATPTPVSFGGSPPRSGTSGASPPGRRCSRPVPAPRPSLARRDDRGPVYANREALDAQRMLEEEPLVELESPPAEVSWCRRSASSPTMLGPGPRESDALLLSDLSSFPQPVPLPEPRSPSPPLIDFSECDEGGHYEEIEFGSCAVVSSSSSGSASSLVESTTAVIDTDSLTVVTAGDKTQATTTTTTSTADKAAADEMPLEGHLSEPASPERYLPATDLAAGQGSRSSLSKEESESAYNAMRQLSTGLTTLDPKSIVLKDKIGLGNFGEVHRAVFRAGALEVQFAVKMLKGSLVDRQKGDILKEARTMAQLDHPHIVRLVGVCESTTFLLVMELAPLGPLNRFLKLNKDLPVRAVLQLLVQVAGAMEYLEARQLVHRDLAARNVLLVNQGYAKVSDFGMSRALGLGKDYYKAEVAGKWPLKWYAPECIYFFKFSIKSDVWSFGVVLWEALSYGERPYQGLMGQDILAMFESEKRLERPEACPEAAYELMRKCWQYRPQDRPGFGAVSADLRAILEDCS